VLLLYYSPVTPYYADIHPTLDLKTATQGTFTPILGFSVLFGFELRTGTGQTDKQTEG